MALTEPHGAAGSGDAAHQPHVRPAADGSGPLLQRDYWGVIQGSRCSPEEIIARLRADFSCFAPKRLVGFSRADDSRPLDVHDTMHVEITGSGPCDVVIVHVDKRSLTLRTLDNHPEAGRITFAASHNPDGHLLFRIRSRARSCDLPHYLGYLLFGKGLQTHCWVHFIEAVARECGGTLIGGEVQTETKEVHDTLADRGELDTPTLIPAREG